MVPRTTGPIARLTAALRDVRHRTAGVLHSGEIERRLDDEMRFHVDMAAERNVRLGMAPAEARRTALAAFGGTERFKDDARDEYRSRVVDEFLQDARYALRVLRRNPGFTAASVLTFALGIGASSAIFSVVNGVLLRPLPYPEPERLVALWERNVPRNRDHNVVMPTNFEAWRDRSRSFEGMAALVPAAGTILGATHPERVAGAEVSPGYFALLGVRPASGREFTHEERGQDVVVLSDGFWRTRLGGDPAALGRSVTIDGRPHTILGIMPADFDPPRYGWLGEQTYWVPFAVTEQNRQWGRFLLVVARLRTGVTLGAARAEMVALAAQRAREDQANEGWSASVVPLGEQITGEVRAPLLVLLGAVGLLLIMAVTNVANLTLALTRRRERELAVRRAIGATAPRLVRQLLTQSALLGAIGGAVGLATAAIGVRALVAALPPDVPRAASISIDGTVLGVTTAVAVLATLALGVVAAARGIPAAGLASSRGGGGRVSARPSGGALVTAEIALGLVLTVLAGLMVRSFVSLREVDLGFDAERTIVARVTLAGDRYGTPDAQRAFYGTLLERLRALPGVQAASEVSTRPFGGDGPATSVFDPARPYPPGTPAPIADFRYADHMIFSALRTPLLAGSTFDERENPDGPPRIIINQTLAQTLWPGENAVGRRVALDGTRGMTGEVIGVVGDVHLIDARTVPRGTVYFASSRFPSTSRDVIVRGSTDDPDALVGMLRDAVTAVDSSVPLYRVATLGGLVDRSLARDRFTTLLLGAFAAIALLLAGVGVYGVFSGDVAQRRKEIGVRLALGAGTHGVIALVMRRALARAAAGIAIGVVLALAAARSMASMVFGVGTADFTSFAIVSVLLLGVAVVATLIPAVRAARVSPLIAIRVDA